jgi:hypothetical protein
MNIPKISFGMIVLNGGRFIKANLRSLYPFAHQLIVVEGASLLAAESANSKGHSRDNTLEVLRDFKEKEDFQEKLIIVTAEDDGYPNGFWPGEKDQQSKAYASRATGDWLWQIDVDEFYKTNDIREICEFISLRNPSMVYFYFRMFMYHPQLQVKGVEPEYCQCQPIPRLFRWGEGFEYQTHRPPTVINHEGISMKEINPVKAEETSRHGWFIWHYPFLYKEQFLDKERYYENFSFRKGMTEWVEDAKNFRRNRFAILWEGLSWLERMDEKPPQQIRTLPEQYLDYNCPDYLDKIGYRFLSWALSLYLDFLIILRTKIFAKYWFRYSYQAKSFPRENNVNRSDSNCIPMTLKKRIVNFLRFWGLKGYTPY